jgi:hypothetical protein
MNREFQNSEAEVCRQNQDSPNRNSEIMSGETTSSLGLLLIAQLSKQGVHFRQLGVNRATLEPE